MRRKDSDRPKTATEKSREKVKKEKRKATEELERFVQAELAFERPVFFVPGWTDEANLCWTSPYVSGYTPVKKWISRITSNPELADYVIFSSEESKDCYSFFDFAFYLKEKIWQKIGKKASLDIVAHSMGGLDAVVSIIDDDPLLNVNSLITVATPHRGSEWGEFQSCALVKIFRKSHSHHVVQGVNLDPDQPFIPRINEPKAKGNLLRRVNKLYCLSGTRDIAVMKSAEYNDVGLARDLYKQKVAVREPYLMARHSGRDGITQDPRAILEIIKILTNKFL